MTPFDLLFIALILASAALVGGAALSLLAGGGAGKWARAGRWLRPVAAAWTIYLPIVALVAAWTPPRILAMGEDLCFDDLCFRVTDVRRTGASPPGSGCRLDVTVGITNRGGGRVQGEGGLRARLWTAGHIRNALAAGPEQTVPLDVRLPPGGRADSVQSFDCPGPEEEAEGSDLVLDHAWTPGDFVIGSSRWLHDPDRIRLSPPAP